MKNDTVLTSISREGNRLLNDKTGRTISTRTAHGLKDTLNLKISDRSAEFIIHIIMILAGVCLFSKTAKAYAIALIIVLIILYRFGGKQTVLLEKGV